MKSLKSILIAAAALVAPVLVAQETVQQPDTLQVLSEFDADTRIDTPSVLDMTVVIGNDTVPMVLPERNLGRFDRGLFNFLFIPKGQWAFGLSASYGEFTTEDSQILSLMKDLDFKGKIYSLKPEVNYFFRNNQSIGFKFNYSRGEADLSSVAIDFDEDINFSLRDISYYTQSYGVALFYRNYVGLSTLKRFAIYNEVALEVSSGSSRFKRLYNDEPRDTRSVITKAALNFSPGVTMFIMDYVSFNVSFGVFGLNLTHESQTTNGREKGTRTTSGANFKFNLFNINFGIGIHI